MHFNAFWVGGKKFHAFLTHCIYLYLCFTVHFKPGHKIPYISLGRNSIQEFHLVFVFYMCFCSCLNLPFKCGSFTRCCFGRCIAMRFNAFRACGTKFHAFLPSHIFICALLGSYFCLNFHFKSGSFTCCCLGWCIAMHFNAFRVGGTQFHAFLREEIQLRNSILYLYFLCFCYCLNLPFQVWQL